MSNTFTKIRYRTLSPLHIGDGDILGPLEYIHDDRGIYYFTSNHLRDLFTDEQLDMFIDYAVSSEKPDLIGFFRSRFQNLQEILEGLKQRASQSHELWRSDTVPGKINTFIKSRGRIYIPGSEIKGALRTAIVSKLFAGEGSNLNMLRREFEEKNERKRGQEKISSRLLRVGKNVNDAKYDFMKFLLVSDSFADKGEYAVACAETLNSSRGIAEYYEVAPGGAEFGGEIGFNTGRQYTAFLQKFPDGGKLSAIFSSQERILEACYEYSARLVRDEAAWFSRQGFDDVASQLEDIGKINHRDSPVIRIGRHQGLRSLTLASDIEDLGSGIYNEYLNMLRDNRKWRVNPRMFPKTRKVIISRDGNMLSPGWVKIEV